MSLIIILTGSIFVIWTLALLFKSTINFTNPAMMVLIMIFALSPFAKYYLHEMGYYEQYGYVLAILLCVFWKKINIYIVPAICSFLSLLISESNVFLVVPIIFAFSFFTIINESSRLKEMGKKILILLGTYIPHIVYCLVIWFVKIPEDLMLKIQEYDRNKVNNTFRYANFVFREDVHLYMSGDRSNADVWERTLRPIHPWCVVTTLVLIIFVSYIIYKEKKNLKLLLSYIVVSIAVALGAYIIVFVAWDLARYYFNIFISVFFVSIFVLKYYIGDIKFNSDYVFVILFVFLAVVGIAENRLYLFDKATYNETWNQFMSLIFERLKC
jgi:hypothetical protein